MNIASKVLGILLAIAIICGSSAAWYADHEHGKIAPLQARVADAVQAASQAAADRDTALQAAAEAQKQSAAAQLALAQAASDAAASAQAASAARGKLAEVSKQPEIAKTLNAPLPKAVWDAIYKPVTGE